MTILPEELVKCVEKVLATSTTIPTWDGLAQWDIEYKRTRLANIRAMHYGNLQVLNKLDYAKTMALKEIPGKYQHAEMLASLEKFTSGERSASCAAIKDIGRSMHEWNVAYVVVSSSMRLKDDLFESLGEGMLRNKSGRWYRTSKMYESFIYMARSIGLAEQRWLEAGTLYKDNILQFPTECGFENYIITGKAIVYAGINRGGAPVLLSLDCRFDLDGHIDKLPESFQVLMFKPAEVTVTKKWRKREKTDGEKFEEGLTVAL